MKSTDDHKYVCVDVTVDVMVGQGNPRTNLIILPNNPLRITTYPNED